MPISTLICEYNYPVSILASSICMNSNFSLVATTFVSLSYWGCKHCIFRTVYLIHNEKKINRLDDIFLQHTLCDIYFFLSFVNFFFRLIHFVPWWAISLDKLVSVLTVVHQKERKKNIYENKKNFKLHSVWTSSM